MVDIPIVTDDGHFFIDNRPLTKQDLGYYIKAHSVKQIKTYVDGAADTCLSFHSIMQKADRNEMTFDEFKHELKRVLADRHNLLDTMRMYIVKSEIERGGELKP